MQMLESRWFVLELKSREPYPETLKNTLLVVFITALLAGCSSVRFTSSQTPRTPLRAPSTWVGEYTCVQGATRLEFKIERVLPDGKVHAVFQFNHPPTGASGSFRMTGQYHQENASLKMQAGEWIKNPNRYLTVDMDGKFLETPRRYEGRIIHPGCGAFKLLPQ